MDRSSYDKRYRPQYAERVTYIKIALPKVIAAKLKARAERDGTRLAPLVRELALAQLERSAFVSPVIEDKLDRLRWLMSNIANNVNQMARHSNQLRVMVEEEDLLVHLEKLERLVIDYTLDQLRPPSDHQVDDPQG